MLSPEQIKASNYIISQFNRLGINVDRVEFVDPDDLDNDECIWVHMRPDKLAPYYEFVIDSDDPENLYRFCLIDLGHAELGDVFITFPVQAED